MCRRDASDGLDEQATMPCSACTSSSSAFARASCVNQPWTDSKTIERCQPRFPLHDTVSALTADAKSVRSPVMTSTASRVMHFSY